MAIFQYFVLLLPIIAVARGAVASRHPRVVNGIQEGSLVNGTVQNPGNFGFIVYITSEQHFIDRDENTNELAWFAAPGQCGGAIIRDSVILTAAHCIKKAKLDTVRVHAGILHKDKPQASMQVGNARNLIWHEDYNEGWAFDIGLIFLRNEFTLNDHVKLINLPKTEDYANVESAVTAGWGRDENGALTDWLKSAEFQIANKLVCEIHTGRTVTDSEICVLGKPRNVTVCKGDSGGPLFYQNVVLGVASKVIGSHNPNGSCNPEFPAVFIKVLSYMDWINKRLILYY